MLQFFPTDAADVYETLTNNNRLMKILDSKELMLKEEMLYADYDRTILSFMKAQLKLENINTIKQLATLLVNNDAFIVSNTIEYLIEHKTLFSEIKKVFGDMDIDEETYREIFYCYKYCYTSSFFQNNAKYFIPEYDINQIEDNEILAPFMDAINKEFDKLDYMLNASRKYISFDDIPFNYINYLGQMFGFETKDIYNASEQRYRELLKNIIEIFKIKGTNYSFELFFQFLGFGIKISEYYFDRRLYYKIDGYNPETKKIAKNDFEYFLTTIDPTKNIINNISVNETITLSDISPQYSLLEFNDLTRQYGVEAVIGYSNFDSSGKIYKDKIYKYFKSNYVYYDIGLETRNLTQEETNSVVKYLEFLTPVFIAKKIQIKVHLGNEEEDRIIFDGDGKGDGTKIGVLPDDFEMLDSEDWDKYNNDERTHDGIISGTKDSQYKFGERVPIVNRWSKKKTTRYDNEGLYPKLMFKRLLRWYDYESTEWSIDQNGATKYEQNIINNTTGLINEFITSYGRNLDQVSFYKKQSATNLLDYNGPDGKNIDDWVKWNAYVERKVDYLINKVEKNITTNSSDVDKIDINFINPSSPITVLDFTNKSNFNEVKIEKSTNLTNVLVAELSIGVNFSHLYNIAYHFNSYIDLLNFTNGQQVSSQKEIAKYIFEWCYVSTIHNNKMQIYQIVPSTLYTSLMFELYVEESELGWDPNTQILEQIPTELNFLSIKKADEEINKYKNLILDTTKDYWEKEQLIEEYAKNLVFIQAQNRYYTIRKRILPSGFVQVFPDSMFDTYEEAITFFNANPDQCYNFRLFWVNENWIDTNTNLLYDRGYYRFAYKNRKVDITFYDDMTGYLYIFDRGIKPTDIKQINYKGKPVIENNKCIIYEYDWHWKGYSEEQDEDDFIFYNTPGQDAELDLNSRYYTTFTDRHYINYHNVHNFIYRPVFEIEERNFNEDTDGIWMLEQILDRTVQAFSDGELHSHEKIGDEPISLTGIIENYLEEPGTTNLNTLRQYFTDVKKFVVEFYKYLVLRHPLPNGSFLINILGTATGNPPVYQYEEFWWNAIYDYTNVNSNTIVKAVYGFILNKIKEVLPEILKNAVEHNHAVQPTGNTIAENINKDIIKWFETYTYPGVFDKDYIDNYNTDKNTKLDLRITSDFFNYIQTFVNTYKYVGEYSTQRYINYILRFFNDYCDTFLTPYHEFLALIKIFRQQVLVHSDPTDINSPMITKTDPNIRFALKYYLLSIMYNEKLSLYRERYMHDEELNASFRNFGEFEYIYYAPKAEFNGQYGFFNFPKTLEISKNNYQKDKYNSRNLPFYGFSMNANNFVFNVSFSVKEDDYNNLLSSYYRITNIINYIDSLILSNKEKEKVKQNLTETYNSQFECIIPVLYLNEFDFSSKNVDQEGVAEQFQNIVFNKELSNVTIQNIGAYILFHVSIPIDSKKIFISTDETLKNYPIGYLRINYLKTAFKENIISIPYQNCHNWIKMSNGDPTRFLSLGSADKIVRNIKNKILKTSDLFEQYRALGDFSGIRDITGIGEDGKQYVNKVINLYEKNKEEYNNIFKITTKNIKDLNIKTIKLIYGEIYNYLNNPTNLIYDVFRKTYTEEYLKNNPTNLIYDSKVYIIERLGIVLKTFLKLYADYNIAEYLYLNKNPVNIICEIINTIYEMPEFNELKELNLDYDIKKIFISPLIEIFNQNIFENIEISKILAFVNWYTGKTVKRGYGVLLPYPYKLDLVELMDSKIFLKYNITKISLVITEPLLDLFVAVAYNSNIAAYSTDGINWTASTLPSSSDWYNVTYGNGKFVTIASNSTNIFVYSTNGINWIQTTLPSSANWYGVTYGNGKFVAVGDDNIAAYSTDGINWTASTLPSSSDWYNVTYGNGKFVTIGYDTNQAAYSTNGINWTAATMPSYANWRNVTYGDGKFVAISFNDYKAAYSTDGITWTASTMPSNAYWRNVAYGDGKFVAIASNSTNAAYSTDGINWTASTLPSSIGWKSIIYGDGKFVAVASSTNIAAYSTDGINWVALTMPSSGDWYGVTYGKQSTS
jgi:hypothetical protein